jgi:putative OPT family oligopeptide transporter
VQTVASAAGTLSGVIFVLPGLVMIGWWSGFPYIYSFAVCAFGGLLGVMYSIPLRRALVTNSDLPYPEGVACAAVLKVGGHGQSELSREEAAASRSGLLAILVGALVSAAFAVVIATQLFASDIARYFRLGSTNAVTGFDCSLSFALLAVGHLVGLWVGVAILMGALIAWAGAVPLITYLHPVAGSAAAIGHGVWSHQVRFIGAGTIGVASLWTLVKLVRPLTLGLRAAIAASRLRKTVGSAALPRTERDIPIGLVAVVTLACMVPLAYMLASFSEASGLGSQVTRLVIGGIVYIALISFFVAAVCGYMAGLIGASNSPVSGVGILVVMGAALLLVVGIKPSLSNSAGPALVAYALFVTSVVFCAATISNDNLQDLKTGQLVDATPWKQQVALMVGVVAGALIIPPILDLLNHAYGFAGAPGVNPARALAAPQATLISALARGVIQHDLDWTLIGIGALIGVGVIALDAGVSAFSSAQLPPLAIGLGIYLPTATTLMIVIGACIGGAYGRRAGLTANPERSRQLGVLMASGMIVGESLIGVLLAGLVVFSRQAAPLAVVGHEFAGASVWGAGLMFAVTVFALYARLNRVSGPAPRGAA